MDSLAAAVDRNRAALTAADQRILKIVLAEPVRTAFLPAAQIATRAGVHEASVVRLAQKLGFEGYPALRAALQEEVRAAASPSARVSRRLRRAGGCGVLESLVNGETAALETLPQHVADRDLAAAANLILAAGRVVLFAYGNAVVLADLLDRRLRRAGCSSLVAAGEGREIAERLVGLAATDVLLAFAFRRPPPSIGAVLAHARRTGARSIVIADMIGHLLPGRPDVLLAAPRGDDQDYLTLTVPMAICNALVLTVARRDRGRSLASLDRLERLQDELGR